MHNRSLVVLLVVFSSLAALAGCAGGGGSSASAPLLAPASAQSSGTSGGSNTTGSAGSGSGVATLTWSAPATNTDGTALTDLAGYKVYYGTSSGSYTIAKDVGLETSYSAAKLGPGTWYFAVTAYNKAGDESNYSNEMTKTIQ